MKELDTLFIFLCGTDGSCNMEHVYSWNTQHFLKMGHDFLVSTKLLLRSRCDVEDKPLTL